MNSTVQALSAEPVTTNPVNAKFLAQMISMGPFVFQTARCLRKYHILATVYAQHSKGGMKFDEILGKTPLNSYSLGVLLDAGISSQLLAVDSDKYKITQVGYFIQFDTIAETNINFSHDVCYKGLYDLDEALETNSPAGLKHFGHWNTIYEGLTQLPETTLKSWFAFDHFYSDGAFPRAIPILLKRKPNTIMDIGGNTGKFAITCAKANSDVQITLVDHEKQVALAREQVNTEGLGARINFFPCDLLDSQTTLPTGYDAVWMSQFLDCFSEEQIVDILSKAKKTLNPEGRIYIMETFTDNQRFETARFCLDMTSLYFTAMANGNSRMYPIKRFIHLIEKAGLKIDTVHENVKLFHTVVECKA